MLWEQEPTAECFHSFFELQKTRFLTAESARVFSVAGASQSKRQKLTRHVPFTTNRVQVIIYLSIFIDCTALWGLKLEMKLSGKKCFKIRKDLYETLVDGTLK